MKDYFGYKDKVCVITGSASGMAKAATEMMVDLGAEVYALDWAEVKIPGIKKYIHVNLGEKASIDAAFKELPAKFDKFMGVAGVAGVTQPYVVTFTINYIANNYITTEYLTKRMNEGGAIGYISSAGGHGYHLPGLRDEIMPLVLARGWEECVKELEKIKPEGRPGAMAYVASKRCMNMFAVVMSKEFTPKHIMVNCVLPAQTQTGLTDDFVKMTGGVENALVANGVAGRFAEAREMAEPLVFLCSDMASFISGINLDVDYGTFAPTVAGIGQSARPTVKVFNL